VYLRGAIRHRGGVGMGILRMIIGNRKEEIPEGDEVLLPITIQPFLIKLRYFAIGRVGTRIQPLLSQLVIHAVMNIIHPLSHIL
jgi:hypothetical protein